MMEYKRLTKKIVDDGTVQISYADRIVGCYHRDEMIRERLCKLEDKIEQGTLIELPCNVDDTVYVIYQYSDFLGTEDEPFIEEDIAHFFVYDENKMKIVPSRYGERSDYWYKVLDILLTREEAEKRILELQGGK